MKALVSTPGSLSDRFSALGGIIRADPILVLALGLAFVAEPHLRRRRQAVLAIDREAEEIIIEAGDIDVALAIDENDREGRLNENFANEIENAQRDNAAVLPASVLNSCRSCRSDRVVATNLLVKCGHYPFCDACVKKDGFSCNLCASKNVPGNSSAFVGLTSAECVKPPTVVQLGNNMTVNKSCGVCQEREGLLTLMPCGHLLFCGPCVLSFKMRCPFCRERITRVVRGFDVRHQELAKA